MKISNLTLLAIMLLLSASHASAQKRRLIYGDLSRLKNEKSFAIKFIYDSMIVGVDTPEKEYLTQKRNDWEQREPGKGSAFVNQWFGDRADLYEPAFIANFEKYSDKKLNDQNATYTIIVKTKRTEGGWTIGITGHPGEIDGEMWIVETANPTHVIAKVEFRNFAGKTTSGGDFEMTNRIRSAYQFSGKWMGDFIRRKAK